MNLEKIKVVKDQKHGQNDVDNHTGQNYNVEQSCIFTHTSTTFAVSNITLENLSIRICRESFQKTLK
jgi:hypothetical protein